MAFTKKIKAFPPPKFLDVPYAGLAVSDTTIRCLQFSEKEHGLVVSSYIEKSLPSGVVISGIIQDVPKMVSVLQSIQKEKKLSYVKVSLPEEKAYLFTTKIPIVPNKDVRSSIEFTMEENVPVPQSELTFDYVVDPVKYPDHLRVIVSALPTAIVNTYVETFQTAGIPLLSLQIESQAVARSLISFSDPQTYLIVHYHTGKIGFYVVSSHIVHFTSTIVTKGILTNDLELLSEEIKKVYVYWHTLKENVGIENRKIVGVIVCGEDIPDTTVSYVASHNKVPVVLGNVWTNAFDIHTVIPEIPFKDSLKCASVVGLALPGHIFL